MRFVQFLHGIKKVPKPGVEITPDGDEVFDLSNIDGRKFHGVLELLNYYGEHLTSEVESYLPSCEDHVKSELTILPPISKPDKVLCVGLNYEDHCEEQGLPLPAEPIIFNKFPSTIIGPYDDIKYPKETKSLDWEAELAIIIGKSGRNINVSLAMDYVFGYTIAHDVSARDWQTKRNGGQWLLGKSMDTFCPLGPAIVTTDELGDPHNLAIRCRVDGVVKQESNTRELVHKTEDLIAYISRFFTLLPGDVILTGTPPGVGCFRDPPEYLQRGHVVECEIEKIGTIRNRVV